MSGSAVFSGTTFQAKAIAYVYVHILGQARLGWLPDSDDTPVSVAGETGGPGDDLRIGFTRLAPIEAQAKHGLKAGDALRTAVRDIATRTGEATPMLVMLLVDPSSSRAVRVDVARDLARLKSGCFDALKGETKALQEALSDTPDILGRLHIVSLDLDQDSGAHTKQARQLLEGLLEDKGQAAAAWDVLIRDAEDLCRDRLRRTRLELVSMLAAKQLPMRPLKPDEHRQLDISRDLLNSYRSDAALLVIDRVERGLSSSSPADVTVLYRVHCQRAVASLQSQDYEAALVYAKKAIDLDPDRVDALLTASNTALEMGDLLLAGRHAERAVRAAPQDPRSWSLQTHVATLSGQAVPVPPVDIATSIVYRLNLAQTASVRGDWDQVETVIRQLLREGERSPDTLTLLAGALLNTSSLGSTRTEKIAEAECLASEVIDSITSPDDPRLQYALSLRANARSLLGRGAEADSDLEQLRRYVGDSPEIVGNLANRRLQSGDVAGALSQLQHAVVQNEPGLLLLRAQAHIAANNREAARRDHDVASALMGNQPRVEWLVARADVAFGLEDYDSAEHILSGIGDRSTSHLNALLTRARLAFVRGDVPRATALFREAAGRDTVNGQMILVELASRFRRINRAVEAVDVLKEAGGTDLPPDGLREYGMSLLAAGELRDTKEFLDQLSTRGPLPDWAVNIGLDVALRSDDSEGAIEHLRMMIARGSSSVAEARLELGRLLAEADRRDEAFSELRAAIQATDISTLDRMKAAHVFAYLGDEDTALSQALLAYRLAPGDEQINRALIQVSHTARKDQQPVESVGADTHVIMSSPDGKVTAYTIYAGPPVDSRASELLLADAEVMGLLGKRVGDRIVKNEGLWNESVLVVNEIQTALKHVVSDVYEGFERRFPTQSFLHGFPVPDDGSIAAFSPLIAVAESNRQHAEQTYRIYREQGFPLGWVAATLRITIPAVMEYLSFSNDHESPLAIEWPSPAQHSGAADIAGRSAELILTRSALVTAEHLNLLDVVRKAWQLTAPRTLIRELDIEAREANRFAAEGRASVGSGPTGLEWHGLDAGHPLLVEQARAAAQRLHWCREYVRIVPRPLQFVAPKSDSTRSLRDLIGLDSWDALELAIDRATPVWADDLGLRRVEVATHRVSATSTIGLLTAMAAKGVVDQSAHYSFLHTLAVRRYFAILPSAGLLLSAFGKARELTRVGLARVLRTLTIEPNIALAARLLVEVLRGLVMAPVLEVSLGTATLMGMEALATRWPRVLTAKSVHEAAGRTLRLLPQELFTVQRVCVDFAKGNPASVT